MENDISKRNRPTGRKATCDELKRRIEELEGQLSICRQAEEALLESEQRYRSLVETMNDGLLVRDDNDFITYVNERLTQMVGYSRDEMVGHPLALFLDETNLAFYEIQLTKRRRGECDPYELAWTQKCGRKISTIMSPRPLLDAHGQVKGSFAVVTDITSRKEAEEGLLKAWAELDEKVKERTAELAGINRQLQDEISERRRAEDALRREHSFRTSIIERAAEGLCVCHSTMEYPYHRFTVWNERMTEITGYSLDEINAMGWYQSLYPDPKAQKKILQRATRIPQGEDIIDEEWEITRADGQTRVVSLSTSILQTDDGVSHVLALVHDITRQKLAEEELARYRLHLELLVAERTSELTKTNALLHLEVGERRRANESLRKVNQRLQDIVDFLPDATFVIDKEGKVLAWNRAIEEMTGVRKKDILGHGDYAYAVPFYGEPRPILIDLVMSGAAGVERRYDFVERTERDVWGEVFVPGTYEGKGAYLWGKASPLFDKNGQVTGAIQSIRDISDRKRAEEELGRYRDHLEELVKERTTDVARVNEQLTLEIEERRKAEQAWRESQQMLQSVLDTIPVRVFWKDLNSDYLGCNRPFALDAGLQSPDVIIGRNDFEMGWAEQAGLYRSDDRLVMESGRPKLGYEEPQTTPDGDRIWLRTNKVPLLNAAGRIKGVLGTYEDITESKRIVEALRTSEIKYRIVADNTHDWEYWKSPERRFLYTSPSCQRITGYTAGEFETDPELLSRIVHPDDLAQFEAHLNQEETSSIPSGLEFRIIHRDGSTRWIGHICQPVFDGKGLFLGRRGSNRDITTRKQAEKALQDSTQKLKLFAYSVAHDLKSPAIGIHGLTKRLCRHCGDVLDEKGVNYCNQILKASEHIAALVEKINVYIATKEARLQIETTNIGEMLRLIEDEFSAQLSSRRIEWFGPDAEIEVRADRLAIARIFRNLVDNALKYGGERLNRISIRYEETEAFHVFSVTDNGQGLRVDDPEKIFGLFQRHETSRGVEGTGLGLAIVKEIAEQHGGKVWIDSSNSESTAFCISISKSL